MDGAEPFVVAVSDNATERVEPFGVCCDNVTSQPSMVCVTDDAISRLFSRTLSTVFAAPYCRRMDNASVFKVFSAPVPVQALSP